MGITGSAKGDIKWSVRQRLELIEMELFWTGRVNRQTLMDKTGISKAQASADFSQYKKLADENLTYSLTEKTYQVTSSFSPVFINTSPQAFLTQLALSGNNSEQLQLPSRDIQPSFLRVILKAVDGSTCLSITYQSMSSPEPKKRVIAPHTFVSDGWRWHVRAYDFLTNTFRDFLLARILEVHEAIGHDSRDCSWQKENDIEWGTFVPLKVVPHPGLSSQQQAVVASDFGMKKGELLFSVRQACLFYTLRQFGFLDELATPAGQQVLLANKDEVFSLLNHPHYQGGDFE